MPNDTKPKDLEEEIPGLLEMAISLMEQKGRAIRLYRDLSYFSFEVDERGIIKYWKGNLPNSNPITESEEGILPEEFLDWLTVQPRDVRQQVHQNLIDYINTETPKERGEVEFPRSDYLFGY